MGTLTARGSVPTTAPQVATAIGTIYSLALLTESVGVTVVVVGIPGPEGAVLAGGIAAMETKAAQMGLTVIKNVAVKGMQKTQQAFKFVKNGVVATADDLLQLRRAFTEGTSAAPRAFKSFDALKRELGPAGPGQVWHHIVEQRGPNVAKFGAEAIHNTGNVVPISREANQAIADYYARNRPFARGLTVRKWLDSQPFAKQREFGLRILTSVIDGTPLP